MVTKEQVIEALYEVYDPELAINIVDLGLIYDVEVNVGHVLITMTLTTPGCPLHDSIEFSIHNRVGMVEGVQNIEVKLVWDPPWNPSKMSDQARKWLWG